MPMSIRQPKRRVPELFSYIGSDWTHLCHFAVLVLCIFTFSPLEGESHGG